MYKKWWRTYKVVVLLIKISFLDVLVAVASLNLKVCNKRSPPRRGLNTSTFWKRIQSMQFESYNTCKSSLHSLSSVGHSANKEIRPYSKWSLTRGSKQWKIGHERGSGRLREVPTVVLDWKKIGALESWSYMGDGSFQWKFDCLLVKEHIKGCGRIAFQVHQAFFPLKHDFVSF